MNAIDILMHEHQFILKVLEALEGFVTKIERDQATDHRDFAEFAEFFSEFADRCHHTKEEDILFEAMAEHGFSKEQGPLAVMYHEHNVGRTQVGIMRDTGGAESISEEQRTKAVEAANTYIMLLKGHIQKEDNVLYPMAVKHLSPEIMEKMKERFDAFESEEMGSGTHQRLHTLGEELIKTHASQT